MTGQQIRALVQRALDDMFCHCYEVESMEYTDDYPCPKCALSELAEQLEADAEAALA